MFRSLAQLFQQVLPAARRPHRRHQRQAKWHPALERLEDRMMMTVAPLTNWTPVNLTLPNNLMTPNDVGIGTMHLLTDGTVMMQAGDPFFNDVVSNNWIKYTPGTTGGYANGTFTAIANSNVGRLFYATNQLTNGNVLVLGGEDSTDIPFTNTGEVYNPTANTWTPIANFPQANFGDDPSEILPNGNILAGYILGPQTYIYNPNSNTWTQTGSKQRLDQSDEESWSILPNGDILSYDIFASINNDLQSAQLYNPSTGTWTKAGNPPAALSGGDPFSPTVETLNAPFFELGPSILLQNGLLFVPGATGATALYNYRTNKWTAGPTIPNGMSPDDAPAAILPDGNVLLEVDAGITNGELSSPPAEIVEYHPGANKFTQVVLPFPLANDLQTGGGFGTGGFTGRMLMLPTGQVLFSDGVSNQLWLYTENTPQTGVKPVVKSIAGAGGTFTLTGTGLNGMNEGAAYGDDAEMSSNYPIIYLKNSSGQVFYATSTNWSLTGVQTGKQLETVNFTLPSSVPNGKYTLFVSGAGLNSQGTPFTVSQTQVAGVVASASTSASTATAASTLNDQSSAANRILSGQPLSTSVPQATPETIAVINRVFSSAAPSPSVAPAIATSKSSSDTESVDAAFTVGSLPNLL